MNPTLRDCGTRASKLTITSQSTDGKRLPSAAMETLDPLSNLTLADPPYVSQPSVASNSSPNRHPVEKAKARDIGEGNTDGRKSSCSPHRKAFAGSFYRDSQDEGVTSGSVSALHGSWAAPSGSGAGGSGTRGNISGDELTVLSVTANADGWSEAVGAALAARARAGCVFAQEVDPDSPVSSEFLRETFSDGRSGARKVGIINYSAYRTFFFAFLFDVEFFAVPPCVEMAERFDQIILSRPPKRESRSCSTPLQ